MAFFVLNKTKPTTTKPGDKMSEFINYNNGNVTIDSYRFANSQATDVEDIIKSIKDNSEENLCASINNEEDMLLLRSVYQRQQH